VPNCFCSGVINIHELSPAAKIKLADDKNLLLAAATCCIIVKQQSQKRRRRRRFWIHPVHQERRQQGDYLHLIQDLRDDPALFSDTSACPWHSSMSYWNCYDLTSICRIPDGVPALTLDNNLPLPLRTVS